MKTLFPLIAAAAISLPVQAEVPTGTYGSVGAGAYRLENALFDDSAFAMKFVGGYAFNEFLAVEAGYSRLFESKDRIDDTRVAIDGNVWDLGTRISYPMGSKFSPFGRIGWSYLDTSAAVTDGNSRQKLNDYDDAFSWAVGAAYAVNDRIVLSTDYTATNISGGDLDSVSLNLSYGFGRF